MSSEDEFMDEPRAQVQDHDNPLAWGKSRDNFYKESDSEYSEVEEEQKEADQIYNKQLKQIDQDDFGLHKIVAEEVDVEQQEGVNYKAEIEALTKQLKKVLKHSRRIQQLSEIPGANTLFSKGNMNFVSCSHTINQAYLMCLLILLDMYKNKMLQLEKHPIMGRLAQLRELYLKSKKQFAKLQPKLAGILKKHLEEEEALLQEMGDEENERKIKEKKGKKTEKENKQVGNKQKQAVEKYLDEDTNTHNIPIIKAPKLPKYVDEEQDQEDFFTQQGDDMIEQGIDKYEKLAQKQRSVRKQIKKDNRVKYLQSVPKQAFDTIRTNQARSINYTISKNRGLTRKRPNQPKGSRVKLRLKYEKAQHKMRSKGKVIYQSPGRVYSGQSNIKSHKLTGVKIK